MEYVTQHERDDLRDEVAELKVALEQATAERDEAQQLLAANVVVRAAQALELNGVTAERDALKAWRDGVPVRELSILVTCLQILIDASGKQRETDLVLDKALDWIESQERNDTVTEVTR